MLYQYILYRVKGLFKKHRSPYSLFTVCAIVLGPKGFSTQNINVNGFKKNMNNSQFTDTVYRIKGLFNRHRSPYSLFTVCSIVL